MFTELDVVPVLKVKKLHPDAIIPKYQTPGAACFDLHALMVDSKEGPYEDVLPKGTTIVVRTGLSFGIPEGWVMLIYSRSGHGFRDNVSLSNCVGVIDSDFRGEILVKLRNDSPLMNAIDACFTLGHGDRIAQAMLIPVHQWHLQEVEELSDTERGAGGFGSTGK